MKLPNGYGSITKLTGNRRKPYMVRVCCGYNENMELKRKVLGYYKTYKDAMTALADYNKQPFDIDKSRITFSELFDMWSKVKYDEITKSAQRMYKSAYSYCKPLYDEYIVDIKTPQMQEIVDKAQVGTSTRARIKSMLKLMFDYALQHDFVAKNYATYVKPPKVEVENPREPFSEEEINLLWQNQNDHFAKIILIAIYTGWRPDELCNLTFADSINIEDMTAKGGNKTTAGKNRVVPFCSKIQPFVRYFYEKGFTHIACTADGKHLQYRDYYREFRRYLDDLGIDHRPHECRHTFATMLDNANVNLKIRKMLLGHSSSDVTEKVYTHKTISQLKEAVELI